MTMDLFAQGLQAAVKGAGSGLGNEDQGSTVPVSSRSGSQEEEGC